MAERGRLHEDGGLRYYQRRLPDHQGRSAYELEFVPSGRRYRVRKSGRPAGRLYSWWEIADLNGDSSALFRSVIRLKDAPRQIAHSERLFDGRELEANP